MCCISDGIVTVSCPLKGEGLIPCQIYCMGKQSPKADGRFNILQGIPGHKAEEDLHAMFAGTF